MNNRILALIAIVWICGLPLALLPQSTSSAAPAQVRVAQDDAPPIPLPKSCGTTVPLGGGTPPCCMFGYVFSDGRPIAQAKVTITSTHGSVEAWTGYGPDSIAPYYQVSLSDPPLQVQDGDAITITATYSNHTRQMMYQVNGGGQQVDVVLPRHQRDDYVFDHQLWQASPPGTFSYPSGVTLDTTGTVYVADMNNARIQVFTSQGQLLRQWGTRGTAPGQLVKPAGIAIDRLGNVYVSDESTNRIERFSITGEWLSGWGGIGGGSGEHGVFSGPADVEVTSEGDRIYVADTYNHRVEVFNAGGGWQQTLVDPNDTVKDPSYPVALALDRDGNVYVAWENNRVQKFSASGRLLVTWSNQTITGGQLANPDALAVDSAGNMYVGNYDDSRILVIRPDGVVAKTWGGQGNANGAFAHPESIALDGGALYIADGFNNRIQKFSPDGNYLLSWGEYAALSGQFLFPKGAAIDSRGNLYIADSDNNRIQQFLPDGTFVGSWGGWGNGESEFKEPVGVAVDATDTIYIADSANSRIQKFSPEGTFVGGWGSEGTSNGQFNSPTGVAVTGGFAYVADQGNNRVQQFSLDGVFQRSWGSEGSGNGQFKEPVAIAADHVGNLYVVDAGNSRIQKFRADGTFISAWGSEGTGEGQFRFATVGEEPDQRLVGGITVGPDGAVYVADSENHRIQRFDANGALLLTWGSFGSGDGELSGPAAVAVGSDGALVVVDMNGQRVQVLHRMAYDRPIATIVKATPRSVVQGDAVELLGSGSDSDETPELASGGYEWTLDGAATPFATTPNVTLPTADLSVGRHTITLRVHDTEEAFSLPQTATIDVSPKNGQAETWTFLLYLDGDATGLTPYLNRDTPLGALYRLQHASPNSNVRVVALYDGDRPGGGDSFRYVQQPDGQFTQEALGEVNMGDPQALINFVRWGQAQAPADHYYLAIADHANGLYGIASDGTTSGDEHLSNAELRQALLAITEGGERPIDVLHYDGCLMGLLENAYQVRGLAKYLVASENLGYSFFAYDRYQAMVGPHTNAQALATAIADSYAARALDAQAPYTIAAFDLSQVNQVAYKVDLLAGELLRYALASGDNRAALLALRAQAQKVDSSGDMVLSDTDEYVDLADWADRVARQVSDPAVQTAASEVTAALPAFVIREHHASGRWNGVQVPLDNVRGLAIYYPPHASATTYQSYRYQLTFPDDTHWDEFLAAELATLPFDSTNAPPRLIAPLSGGQLIFLPVIQR